MLLCLHLCKFYCPIADSRGAFCNTGSPDSAEEYLRRVRAEAAALPQVGWLFVLPRCQGPCSLDSVDHACVVVHPSALLTTIYLY
jgi:hypothetical protein